jgi:hypothetical protein
MNTTMLRAEILKLRKLPGPMAVAFLLTVGTVALYFVAVTVRDSPQRGGPQGLLNGATLLGLYFGMFAATLVGAEAGSLDRGSGVLRDLVATGRSRTELMLVRIPAALAVALALNLGALLVAVLAAVGLHDARPVPSAGLILQTVVWVTTTTIASTCLALAVSSLTGSRSITLTAVIAWQTVATTLLYAVPSLGRARELLLMVALTRLRPGPPTGSREHPGSLNALPGLELPMPVAVAVLVTLAWTVLPLVIAVRQAGKAEV